MAKSWAADQKPIDAAHIQFENLPLETVSVQTGRFEEPSLMEGSSVELAFHHAGYMPTQMATFAGQNSQAILLPAKTVRMLQKSAADAAGQFDRNDHRPSDSESIAGFWCAR